MNIKEHIEAGHYPKDDQGRALVPTRRGEIVTVYATDHPGGYPIAGRINTLCMHPTTCSETGDNKGWGVQPHDLLPPSPRKVKVKACAIMYGDGRIGHFQIGREDADKFAAGWKHHSAFVVDLTGEYEEPWS